MRAALAGVAACVVVALVTAGAFQAMPRLDEDDGGDADAVTAAAIGLLPPQLVRNGLDAPRWSEGDAWFVTFNDDDFGCVATVVDADAAGYRQGFACDGDVYLAAEDAAGDYPFLGAFTDALAGVTAGGDVVFYDWPLTDGKTWTTEWSGLPLRVEATYVPDLDGPEGPEAGYSLVMVDEDDDVLVQYDYVPSLGWWSFMKTDGGLDMRVVERGSGWRGAAVHAEAEQLLRLERSPSQITPLSPPFEVEEGTDWLAVVISRSGNGFQDLELRDPDGEARYAAGYNGLFSGASSFQRGYVEDLTPGGWSARDLVVTGGRTTTTIYGITFETSRLR